MRVQLCCLLVWPVLALTGCSSGLFGLSKPGDSFIREGYDFSEVESIAIVDVVGALESEVMKNQVAECFTAQLLKKGYAPIERQRAQGLLSKGDFSTDHAHPELYAVEAGQALQVPVVMLVSIPSFGDEISITAKLIDVDSGSAVWLGRTSRGFRKHRKSSSGRGDFTDDGFGDNFSASLYGHPSMGFGRELAARDPKPMLTTLSLEEESRVRDMVKKLCKSLPSRASRRGLGNSLLGLIDDRPARNQQTPVPRVREDLHRPEPQIPEVRNIVAREAPKTPPQEPPQVAIQQAPRIPVQEIPAPTARVREPYRARVQEPYRARVQEPLTAPVREPYRAPVRELLTAPVREPYRAPVQLPPRMPDQELRTISPGTAAPIQRKPGVVRSGAQRPKSIFERGFADALARQPVYITEKTTPRMTPPLQSRPQVRQEPIVMPIVEPIAEPIAEPAQKKTLWRRPSKVQPEPKTKSKKSFWKGLLGLE